MSMRLPVRPTGLLLGLLIVLPAQADLNSDLGDFFNSMNLSNVTRPGVYQGQSAGYYTAGGLFVRIPQRNYSILEIQWPRFRAGCGGIDLFAGGFSFINSDELVNLLRNIGSAAISYAFMLALRTISPQIASTVEQLQDWAQRFNLGNVNSCETARGLIGAGMEHYGVQNAACVLERVETQGESWAEARRACSTGGRRAESLNRARADPNLAPVLVEGNLSWRALMRNSFFRSDLELAQFVMNLSGIFIVRRDNPGSEDSTVSFVLEPSILQDRTAQRVISQLIEGSSTEQIELQLCAPATPASNDLTSHPDTCTQLVSGNMQILPANALRTRVQTLLQEIHNRILSDQPPSAAHQAFLENLSLPVYKYLTVRAAFLFSSTDFDLQGYATLIAKDLVLGYLQDLMGKLEGSAYALSQEGGKETLQLYREQVFRARQELHRISGGIHRQFNEALAFTERIQLYEQLLAARVAPALVRSAQWQISSER